MTLKLVGGEAPQAEPAPESAAPVGDRVAVYPGMRVWVNVPLNFSQLAPTPLPEIGSPIGTSWLDVQGVRPNGNVVGKLQCLPGAQGPIPPGRPLAGRPMPVDVMTVELPFSLHGEPMTWRPMGMEPVPREGVS